MTRHAVVGQVLSGNGAPVAGAFVMVTGGTSPSPDIAARTDRTGCFRLALPDGHFTLEAHHRDAHGRVTIDVEGEMTPVRLVVKD
ncbi:hypothetical protein J3E64_000702 [Sphingobium sp. OAS761]|uniref:carboxypeptidase-like regulatory domain-containing protein n=1 Tax=Sphingobium sp. OAS761 TaxID=2817901 RepID=UPI00209E1E78|nr:carboxypeptidase-like regulatory domain-containing protein [Sphingobium sp. OAS761]MCP1469031.1 hypothetical protein [Sphingobium sp. OAS761]